MAADREQRALETEGPEIPEGWALNGEDFTLPDSEDDGILDAIAAANPDDPLLRLVVNTVRTMRDFGGVAQIAPVRVHIAGDLYRTVEWVVRWNPYNPPVRRADEGEEVREPEPEAVEA